MSLDSELADEMKRRREQEKHPSKKSKITARTSQKTDEENKSGMEQMTKMMRELAMDRKDIKKEQYKAGDEITQLKNEIKELKDQQSGYKDEIKKLRETNEKAIKQIGQLEKEISIANEKIEKLERERKRKNVIIQGIKIDTNDQKVLRGAMENFMEKELQVSVDVNGARKIGENTVIVELNSVKYKIEVMKNKSKLKTKKDERIYIN
uniref:Dynein regulatory complex subunit 4-like n=1 Tax=Diabrotica virgifera virgifera TaxID=50390 RepID=A0A6P7GVC6_DIAVI